MLLTLKLSFRGAQRRGICRLPASEKKQISRYVRNDNRGGLVGSLSRALPGWSDEGVCPYVFFADISTISCSFRNLPSLAVAIGYFPKDMPKSAPARVNRA